MDSCVNNNSTPAVGRTPNLGSQKKISHRASLVQKCSSGINPPHASPRLSGGRSSNTSTIARSFPHSPSSTQSQSQGLPTKRRHSRTKAAIDHLGPLFRGKPADSRMDRDVVTGTASSALNQDRGSVKTHTATREQRGTSTPLESSLDDQSRLPKTRRLHVYDNPNFLDLDIVASRHESRVGASTALRSGATAEKTSVKISRGFRARLMLSQARKAIENHKPVWPSSTNYRKLSHHQRAPFIMDIVLELKAQYAGYTTEDMYVTFEAMRRKEDARPVFEHLAHDFSAGAGNVDAYWDGQASVWRRWKTPTDDYAVGGSTFPTGLSPQANPVSGVFRIPSAPPSSSSSSLSVGRAHFPDSIERSTASWCPVLNCDYVAGYYGHPQHHGLTDVRKDDNLNPFILHD